MARMRSAAASGTEAAMTILANLIVAKLEERRLEREMDELVTTVIERSRPFAAVAAKKLPAGTPLYVNITVDLVEQTVPMHPAWVYWELGEFQVSNQAVEKAPEMSWESDFPSMIRTHRFTFAVEYPFAEGRSE